MSSKPLTAICVILVGMIGPIQASPKDSTLRCDTVRTQLETVVCVTSKTTAVDANNQPVNGEYDPFTSPGFTSFTALSFGSIGILATLLALFSIPGSNQEKRFLQFQMFRKWWTLWISLRQWTLVIVIVSLTLMGVIVAYHMMLGVNPPASLLRGSTAWVLWSFIYLASCVIIFLFGSERDG